MKKLLVLLSTIIITGTSIQNVVATSVYEKVELNSTIISSNFKTNNLKKIIRNKREDEEKAKWIQIVKNMVNAKNELEKLNEYNQTVIEILQKINESFEKSIEALKDRKPNQNIGEYTQILNKVRKKVTEEVQKSWEDMQKVHLQIDSSIGSIKECEAEKVTLNKAFQEWSKNIQKTSEVFQKPWEIEQKQYEVSQKLKEAKQEEKEALQKVIEARKKLEEAQQKWSKALQKLKEAEQEEKEATQKLKEALQKTTEATQKLEVAEQEKKEASQKLEEAKQKVKEAEQEEKEATQKLKEAEQEEKEATQKLIEARQKVNEADKNFKEVEQEKNEAIQKLKETIQKASESNKELGEGDKEWDEIYQKIVMIANQKLDEAIQKVLDKVREKFKQEANEMAQVDIKQKIFFETQKKIEVGLKNWAEEIKEERSQQWWNNKDTSWAHKAEQKWVEEKLNEFENYLGIKIIDKEEEIGEILNQKWKNKALSRTKREIQIEINAKNEVNKPEIAEQEKNEAIQKLEDRVSKLEKEKEYEKEKKIIEGFYAGLCASLSLVITNIFSTGVVGVILIGVAAIACYCATDEIRNSSLVKKTIKFFKDISTYLGSFI